VGIDKIEFFNLIKEVFEDKNIKKVLFDYKKVLHLLDDYKIGINGEVFDCLIPLYIFNASDKYLSIDSLCERYNLDSKCYASSLINSENTLKNQLKDEKVLDLYNKIDFPLEKVLFSMEQNGVKIDTNRLNELDKIYSGELEKVVNEIKNMNQGQDINLNSPKQLSTFLFDTLKLVPPDSKSRSTDIDTLIKLQNDNEIVKLIIQYRKLQKIKTTYIDVFKSLTKDTDFIYCSFNQTTTSTGRLSSTEPNLQNIPARDEEGKDIRELFISRFE
jgi:DNA polymerase-1